MDCPAQGPRIYLSSSDRTTVMQHDQNRPAHEAHLQQGSTNPEYKSTQQDLTEIKLRRLRNAGLGIQGMALAILKVFLRKSSLQNFSISIFKLHKNNI